MIRRSLEIIAEAGRIIELRAPKARVNGSKVNLVGYYSDLDKLSRDAEHIEAPGVYVTLNVLRNDMSSRCTNGTAPFAPATRDEHIERRRWLLIDADVKRPADVSTSDREHEEALTLIQHVADTLRTEGWPDPVEADSGNGGHLLYRIDLPAADGGLVKRVLMKMARRFNTDEVEIDQGVYNPARICKLYGTWARKGQNTPDRPHRLSRILKAPSTIKIVTSELLERFVGSSPAPDDHPATYPADTISDVRNYLREHKVKIKQEKKHDQKFVFVISPCPMNPEHGHDTDTAVTVHPDGRVYFNCMHNHCLQYTWDDVRRKIDPDGMKPPSSTKQVGITTRVIYRRLSDLTSMPVNWWWKNRFPAGELSMLFGDPCNGKTTLALDCAAHLTTGKEWPDKEDNEQGSVIILTGEDSIEKTILPRLKHAGGDVSKVVAIDRIRHITSDGLVSNHLPDLGEDCKYFTDMVEELGDVKLMIVDPVSCFLGVRDTHQTSQVRHALLSVHDFCKDTGIAVLMVGHMNKGKDAKALYRASGSLGFIAASRAAWLCCEDRNDPELRMLAAAKLNLSRNPGAMSYRIMSSATDPDVAVIQWEQSFTSQTADDILEPKKETTTEIVTAWLREVLAEGPMSSDTIIRLAGEAGHRERTVWRAKAALGLKASKVGFGNSGQWEWRLR